MRETMKTPRPSPRNRGYAAAAERMRAVGSDIVSSSLNLGFTLVNLRIME